MEPLQVSLDITPRARLALTDVRSRAAALVGDELDRYRRCLYSSLHTTAGYLPQSLRSTAGGRTDRDHVVSGRLSRALSGAGRLSARSAGGADRAHGGAEDCTEPLNGDSHLTFILGRLRACVSYPVGPGPVYFVDLDGVYKGTPRRRTTVLVSYNDEVEVARTSLDGAGLVPSRSTR